jgi:hypothetical protein
MRRLILLLSMFPALAHAATETPSQALKNLPPLPSAAAANLDCSAGEAMRKKVEEVTARMMAAAQPAAYSQTPGMMTEAQTAAMQAMTEPEYNMCPSEVMDPQQQAWLQAAAGKLEARLAQVDAAKARSDNDYCKTHSTGEMCEPDPDSGKRFNPQAVAAATQFLKDAQPGYAGYLKLVGGCVALRDKPIAGARGVTGPFQVMATGAEAQTWSLVGFAADAQGKACATAREAARRYLVE